MQLMLFITGPENYDYPKILHLMLEVNTDLVHAASDVEMGPLCRPSSTTSAHDDASGNHMSLAPVLNTTDHRHNLHEAIDALILFRRALRAHV